MRNRLLAVFIAAAMVLSGFSAAAFAETLPEGFSEEAALPEETAEEGILAADPAVDDRITAVRLLPETEILLTEFDESCGSWQAVSEEGTAYRDPFRFFYSPAFREGDRIEVTTASGTFTYVLGSFGEEFASFVPEEAEGAPYESIEAALAFTEPQDDRQFQAGDTVGLRLQLADGQVFDQEVTAGIADDPDLAVIGDILYRLSADGTEACADMPMRALAGDVLIPGTVSFPDGESYPVTSVNGSAFCFYPGLNGEKLMTSVTLPETVTGITEGLGYYRVSENEIQTIPDFMILGKEGTYAQTYAEACGFAFTDNTAAPAVGETPDSESETSASGQSLPLREISLRDDNDPDSEEDRWKALQDRIDAAAYGEVITLNGDVINTQGHDRIKVDKTITIDLNGYKLDRNRTSQGASGHVIEVFEGGMLTITDNSPDQSGIITGGYSMGGGGIFVNAGATLLFSGGTITGNNAGKQGGGIYAAGTVYMTGGTITDNTAHEIGGGIYSQGMLNITGGSITHNTANREGGGIYVDSSSWIALSDADISGNIAKKTGGGIQHHSTADGSIEDCSIIGNHADGCGGGLYVDAYETTLSISGTHINENYSGDEGGGICLYYGTVSMGRSQDQSSSLTSNRAKNDGAGVIITNKTTFNATGVTISSNTAENGNGGGVMNYGTATFDGCTFSGNSAKTSGGGIFNDTHKKSAGDVTLENCTVSGNRADKIGGGIYNNKKLRVIGGSITGNFAGEGGHGIFTDSDSEPVEIGGRLIADGNGTELSKQDILLGLKKTVRLAEPLVDGSHIGITMLEIDELIWREGGNGIFTEGYSDKNGSTEPSEFFYSPDGYDIVFDDENKEAQIVSSWSSLQGAIDSAAADGRTLDLSRDYVADTSCDRLKITQSVTINLNGHTLDRNLSSEKTDGRIFEVYGGAMLTIQDNSPAQTGKITGGYANNGGGIYVHENAILNIEKGTLTACTARGNGGGIYSDGTVNISGGTISGNTAHGSGGGIYADKHSTVWLSNASFSGNSAHEGAGMYLHMEKDASITNCTINQVNNAGKNGGGLLWDASGHTLSITGTAIDGNTADEAGGGIYLREGTIVIGENVQSDSLITNNTASNGGGVKVTKGTSFTAANVLFSGNKASGGEGGGIKTFGTTNLTNCTFNSNSSKKEGGGIFNDNDGSSAGDLSLETCTFSGNTSKSNGGGIYSDKVLTIVGGTEENGLTFAISGNTAEGKGGGIFIGRDSKDVFIQGRIDVRNNEASAGNDLYLRKDRKLTLTDVISGTRIGSIEMDEFGVFTDQYSQHHPMKDADGQPIPGNDPAVFFDTDEGAMPVEWWDDKEAQMHSDWPGLQDLINSAAESGAPVDLDKDYMAGSDDKALQIPENKSVTINLNGFTLNRHLSSKKDNGSVIEVNKKAELTINDESANQTGTITGGFSDYGGGIRVYANGTLNMTAGTITGNQVSKQGGGIYIHGDGTLNMTGGTVSGNVAGDDGGGIFVDDGGLIAMSNAAVTGNQAHCGGGLSLLPKEDAVITDCTITGNSAKEYGGGLFLTAESRTLTIRGTAIEGNNSGDDGGGIYIKGGTIVMESSGNADSTLSGNVSSRGGGGAKIAKGTAFMANGVDISNNQAASKEGGGIKNFGDTTLANCTVKGNTSVKSGGGIFNESDDKSKGKLTLENCEISGNSTESCGGGICSDKDLEIGSSSIFENSAEYGGGIYVGANAGTTGIQGDLTVVDNTASVAGDDVYLCSGKVLTLTDALTGNTMIGIDLEKGTGVFTADYSKYCSSFAPEAFFMVRQGYWMILNDAGEAEIQNDWILLKYRVENAESGTTVTVDKDYTAASADDRIIIPEGREITIDLNGHTLDRNRNKSDFDGHVIEVLGTLTLVDNSDAGTGTITGGWADHGGGINIGGSGTLSLNGGTVSGNKAVEGGGGIYAHGILVMTGGTVRANESAGPGGGIGLGESSTLNLQGGTVTGNKTDKRGGGIISKDGAKFYIQGSPVVKANDAANSGNDIYLPSENRLFLSGALEQGAMMGIALEEDLGEFTNEYSTFMGGEDPAKYFVSTQGYEVYCEEGREAALRMNTYGETDYEKPFIDMGGQINTDTETLGNQNWLSGISGERYLHEINMPGSHDSGMCSVQQIPEYIRDWTSTVGIFVYPVGAYYAKTQVLYINHQMEQGARQLDIRLNDCYKTEKWYGYVWADDGRNLWISHGTHKSGGNYLAVDGDGNFISFYQVLDWIKDFLKAHPTETIILNLRPQTTRDGHDERIRWRIRENLEESALEINPSTGEPYLYRESGSDSPFAPYTRMPQLKDCRGKIVLLPDDDDLLSIIGGLMKDAFVDYTDPTHYELTYIEKVAEEEKAYREMNGDGSVKIPVDADTNNDFLWYWELNSTGEDQGLYKNYTSFVNPVQIADYVNPRLIGEGKPFGQSPMGQYLGWVRIDGFEAKYAEAIWRTNFPDLEYCTVTVQSGLGDNYPDQIYMVLKGTMLTLPGNIYKQLPDNQYLGSWRAGSDVVCNPGDTYKVEEDVTFVAQWLDNEMPVRVIWQDANDRDKERPSSHSIDLAVTLNDGSLSQVTLTEKDHWSGTVSGNANTVVPSWGRIVPTADNPLGQDTEGQYRYEVVHEEGSGYVFTLYHTPDDQVDVSGKITWDDADDADGLRPASVTLSLHANGAEDASMVVTANGDWAYDFSKLPQYADGIPQYRNGQKIDYDLVEEAIDGYGSVLRDYSVTYTHEASAENAAQVMGTMDWEDADNVLGIRPEKVVVYLLANGEEYDSTEITAGEYELWEFGFDQVPLRDDNGQAITYSVTIDEIQKYTTTVEEVSPDQEDPESGDDRPNIYAYCITNTLIVDDKDKTPAEVEEKPRALKLTYNGEEQTLIRAGSDVGGTMLYALSGDDAAAPAAEYFSEDLPAASDAGSHYVWYYVKGDILHTDTEPACIGAPIGRRPVTFTGSSDTKQYTGSEIEITGVTEDGLLEGHTHNAESSAKGTDVGRYEGTITAKDDVVIMSGETDVTANYEITTESGTLIIEQDPNLEFTVSLEGKTYVYDGEPHALPAGASADAASGETVFKYSRDGEAWTEDLSSLTATDVADSCTIMVRATNPNYANPAEGSAALTIEQDPELALTVSLSGKTFTYNGKPHRLPAEAETDAASGETTIEYSKDGEAWTTDLASLTAVNVADSCTILVRASNPNYANPAEGSADLTVKQAAASITVDNASKVRGEDDPAFTGTVEGLAADGDLGKVKYIRTNTDEEAGTYEGVLTAEYTENPNYSVSITNGDFTIRELYTLIWLDGDDTELQSKNYAEGDPVPAYDGSEPTKAATEKYSYSFTGWDEGTVSGTTTTYKPLFRETVNKYTVKFVNYDGTVLQSGKVAYGEMPAYTGETPVREAPDEWHKYGFMGWEPEIAEVTGNAEYTAHYELVVTDPVVTFVIRLYNVCLDRDPDPAGLTDWVTQLKSGKITGVKAAQGFIFSQEFQNRNYCNRHFVEQLYRAFMGREYDEGGLAYWINKLETGSTREAVFNGFALSPEFTQLCSDYGINRGGAIGVGTWGTVPHGTCTMVENGVVCGEEDGVTAFVKRLYNIALNREAEPEGLANWTNQLWNHTNTGKGVAKGFIFSAEFTNRNLNNEEFVDCMYHTFFDRDGDPAGTANWVSQLNSGKSRLTVFNGFADSKEFSNLCLKYGIRAT